MNKHVHRMLCKKYEQSARMVVEEMKGSTNDMSVIQTQVVNEYKENLKLLRIFLDNAGMRMPKPKWRYNPDDQSTWLFTPHKELNKHFMMLQRKRR
jgi:hypothetical protein